MSSMKEFINEYKPFLGLLIFGNIENLVLSGTKSAMKYSRHIEFIGGFAIFVLGIQSMLPLINHLL